MHCIKSVLQQQEDLDILNWLIPSDFGSQHSVCRELRQPKTGRWFIESTEYQIWRNEYGKVLFCQGIPGAGKTILSSIVIDNITSYFSQKANIGIAYIYCDFRHQHEQTAINMITSLTKQLSKSREALPQCIKDLYEKHKRKSTRPSIEEVYQTLAAVVELFSQVYVVIDALDEVQSTNGCRMTFLEELRKVQRSSQAFNLLVTSRPIADIARFFEDAPTMQISAHREDVESYINSNMSKLHPSCIEKNPMLKEQIKETIAQAVDGM